MRITGWEKGYTMTVELSERDCKLLTRACGLAAGRLEEPELRVWAGVFQLGRFILEEDSAKEVPNLNDTAISAWNEQEV